MKKLLEDAGYIHKLDKSNMLGLLLDFSGQLKRALKVGDDVNLARVKGSVSNIVFSGVGGSAIGGDVVRCGLIDELKVPLIVNRDYDVARFVGQKTLFFASSYSGNTEETISAYKGARRAKANIVVLTGGGELERLARRDGYAVIDIPEKGIPPRCALGYSFVPILMCLSQLGLVKDKRKDIQEAADTFDNYREDFISLSKRLALALFERFCAIYGASRHSECVATRWRNQLGENSKALATSHFLPEMNHNEVMGFSHPKDLLKEVVVIFLRDREDHIRVKHRIDITSRIIKERVCKIIEVSSRGGGLLSRLCSLLCIGDFVSFYLAILNGEDPTPVDEIVYLKKELAKR